MSWQRIKECFRDLVEAVDAGAPLAEPWERFRATAEATVDDPPYHLLGLLEALEAERGARPRAELAILDHGCGGGLTLLYLAARGYANIWGVDILTSNCARWNRLTREVLGAPEDRFFTYDGVRLPIDDASIDVVFSQEVLEHVRPDVLESYYAEERRVLRRGGLAIHGVPHRLTPFDSHTRTWFLHWVLPRRLWLKALKAMGRDVRTAEAALFLRWPWVHRRLARRAFGSLEDRTAQRMLRLASFDYYDGPVRLRRLLARIVRAPVIGRPLCAVLTQFVMMDTVSRNVR